MEELIAKLCAYHHPHVFNPWSEYDESCDMSPDAPAIRCQQLKEYLAPRLSRARIVLIAEAAGYQGCRFTGIPITCERMLLDEHKQISSAVILGHRGQRTSRPDSPFMTSRPQREKGMNEPTDTYVWGAVVDNGLDPRDHLSVYGSDIEEIRELIRHDPDLGRPLHYKLPYLRAEVVWAVRREWAQTMSDVLRHRTRAIVLDAAVSMEIAPDVAAVMARELGRDAAWAEEQVRVYRELARGCLAE